jgi:orotidine-5'-phosphate decarboxylase
MMSSTSLAAKEIENARDKIIVALDVDTAARARELVETLRGRIGAVKIGLELFVSTGPDFVRELVDSGCRVFLDLKYHDIPNTVARAAAQAAGLGVWMLNVHADGGTDMMRAAAAAIKDASLRANQPRPYLIAVTVLTSRDDASLRETGHEGSAAEQVVRLARLAKACGLDGVVASAQEARGIRTEVGRDFLIVTPGIRNNAGTSDDQKRVTTFAEALSNGSSYVVIGRPITGSSDPAGAVEEILGEIAI